MTKSRAKHKIALEEEAVVIAERVMNHMPRKAIKREVVEIKSSGQPILAERRELGSPPKWIIWLSYSQDRTEGTYLILNNDGSMWRETTHGDGSTSVVVIKPADKHV